MITKQNTFTVLLCQDYFKTRDVLIYGGNIELRIVKNWYKHYNTLPRYYKKALKKLKVPIKKEGYAVERI